MADIFDIKLPDGRIVGIQADTPEQAAQGARNVWAREKGGELAKGNYAAGLADSFAKGQSFGVGDELGAAANATLAPVSRTVLNTLGLRQPQESDNDTWRQRYEKDLAFKRGFSQQFEKDNPVASTAAQIGGNVLTTGLAVPQALTAAGPSLGGNMVRMGLTGAGLGGAQSFAEGEGGFDERRKAATTGAVYGGILGAAVPVAGAIGRVAAESGPGRWVSQNVVAPVAQRIAGAFEGTPARSLSAAAPDGTPGVTGPLTQFAQSVEDPSRSGALDRLSVAFQRSGMSRDQFERKLAELGPEAMLADLDAQFRTQARNAYVMPGDTRSHAEVVLPAREAGRPDRIVRAFEGDTPPPTTDMLKGKGQAFDANSRAVGERAYGEMRDAGLNMSDEMLQLKNVPAVRDAIAQVEADAVHTGAQLTPVEVMHQVKQKLNDTATAAFASGKPVNKAQIGQLADRWEEAFWRANEGAKSADAAYRQSKSLPEFFDRGYNFLTTGRGEKALESSSSALARALSGADVQQVTSTRAGMVNAARDEVSGRNPLARSLALARDLDPRVSRDVGARIGQVFEPAQAKEIGRVGASEITMDQTKRGILGGPDTASKLADMFDNAGVRVADGKPSLRWWETIKDIASRATAPNEAVRNQIGQMTLNPRSDETRRLLAEILARVDQRKAGRPLAASLAGTTGAQFGGP